MSFKSLAASIVALLLTGCIAVPEKLSVDEGVPLTNFTQVKDDAVKAKGSKARWGGVIAKVTNEADMTILEVVHFELKSSTRPKVKDQTQGRFRIHYSGLLDPIIYKEGRSVTAIGIVGNNVDGKIGEHEYTFPVLKADYVHLWKEVKEVDVRIDYQPYWYAPSMWYYPRSYYYHPLTRSYKKPVIKTVNEPKK